MEQENWFAPSGLSDGYTIIEICMIEDRIIAAKKKLIRLLFDTIQDQIGIAHQDIELHPGNPR